MKCRNCTRPAKHWLWHEPLRVERIHITVPTCSRICMEILTETKPMVDPNPHEVAAMSAASDRAGEYLESIGKTDLTKLTEAEWTRFIHVTCGGYVDRLCELQAEINMALGKARVG